MYVCIYMYMYIGNLLYISLHRFISNNINAGIVFLRKTIKPKNT